MGIYRSGSSTIKFFRIKHSHFRQSSHIFTPGLFFFHLTKYIPYDSIHILIQLTGGRQLVSYIAQSSIRQCTERFVFQSGLIPVGIIISPTGKKASGHTNNRYSPCSQISCRYWEIHITAISRLTFYSNIIKAIPYRNILSPDMTLVKENIIIRINFMQIIRHFPDKVIINLPCMLLSILRICRTQVLLKHTLSASGAAALYNKGCINQDSIYRTIL